MTSQTRTSRSAACGARRTASTAARMVMRARALRQWRHRTSRSSIRPSAAIAAAARPGRCLTCPRARCCASLSTSRSNDAATAGTSAPACFPTPSGRRRSTGPGSGRWACTARLSAFALRACLPAAWRSGRRGGLDRHADCVGERGGRRAVRLRRPAARAADRRAGGALRRDRRADRRPARLGAQRRTHELTRYTAHAKRLRGDRRRRRAAGFHGRRGLRRLGALPPLPRRRSRLVQHPPPP